MKFVPLEHIQKTQRAGSTISMFTWTIKAKLHPCQWKDSNIYRLRA